MTSVAAAASTVKPIVTREFASPSWQETTAPVGAKQAVTTSKANIPVNSAAVGDFHTRHLGAVDGRLKCGRHILLVLPRSHHPSSSHMIASYVAEYVRLVLADEHLRNKMVTSIRSGKPFVMTDTLAVVMLDISGYSKFTARVAEMGKVSSEIVTESVGRYLSEIINIIYSYGGDIVKFLGDAVLVTFAKKTASETLRSLLTRATLCCVEVLKDHGLFQCSWDQAFSLTQTNERPTESTNGQSASVELKIHVAITWGECDQIVYGTAERMDYCVTSPCMPHLGPTLNLASSGQIGFSSQAWEELGLTNMRSFGLKPNPTEKGDVYVVHQDLMLPLWEALSDLTAFDDGVYRDESSMMSKSNADRDFQGKEDDGSINPLLFKFINQSHLRYLLRWYQSSGQTGLTSRSSFAVPRGRGSVFQRHGLEDDGNAVIPKMQEYRQVSIVFVQIKSVKCELSVQTLQKIMVLFLAALEKENGTFQQISVTETGDVITLAARIMSLEAAENKVVCDIATKSAAEHDCSFEKLGDFLFKGKTVPLEIFQAMDQENAIAPETAESLRSSNQGNGRTVIGYKSQQEHISSMVKMWTSKPEKRTLILEGASGLGKSTLVKLFMDECTSKDIAVRPYFGIRAVLSTAMAIFRKDRRTTFKTQGASSSVLEDGKSSKLGQSRISFGYHQSQTRLRTSYSSRLVINADDDDDFRSFLLFCNEDPRLAPLLTDIAPHLKIKENGFTSQLDGKARASNIQMMMVRMLKALRSQGHKFALVFDDAQVRQFKAPTDLLMQWLDPSSLDIVNELTEEVPQLLMLVSSRPVSVSANESIRKVLDSDAAEKIVLEGLAVEDTEELLRLEVREKAGGSPLFTDMIAASLGDAIGERFGVTDDGLLVPLESDSDVESFFAADIGTGIRSQFDRLDAKFQEFLRVASVFGQYFTLEDVNEVCPAEVPVKNIVSMIEELDMFGFLVCTTPENEDGEDLEFAKLESYAFRHITIMLAIYETMPYLTRVALHSKIATMLEERSRQEHSRESLLPVISYHYGRSDMIEPRIDVSEELGSLYYERWQWCEACNLLLPLADFVGTNADLIARSLPGPSAAKALATARRASWFAMSAYSLSQQKDFARSRDAAQQALLLLGIDFSALEAHKKKNARATQTALVRQLVLYFRTKGGTRLVRRRDMHGHIVAGPRRTHEETARYASFSTLLFALFFGNGKTIPVEMAPYIMFEALNAAITTAASYPTDWVCLSLRVAYATFWGSRGLSGLYLKPFFAVGDRIGDSRHMESYFAGMVEFFLGHWEKAKEVFGDYARVAEIRGIKRDHLGALAFKALLESFTGDYDTGYGLLPWVDLSPKIDAVWAPYFPARMAYYNIIHGHWTEASRFIDITINYLLVGNPTYVTLGHMGLVWMWTLEKTKDPDKLRTWAEYYVSIGNTWKDHGVPDIAVMEGLLIMSCATCAAVIPWRDVDEPVASCLLDQIDRTTAEAVAASMAKLAALARAIGFGRRIPIIAPTAAVLELCLCVARQGKFARPLRVVERLLRGKGYGGEVFREMRLLRGVAHWVVGTLVRRGGRDHHSRARDLFAGLNSERMLQILEVNIAATGSDGR
ncbi:hypothetical protein HDU96_008925 [Phlyctochytrium bullatum]|nr:hypothetical protein HDU96_008925 [Phlyctochytrium bullatum]